MAKRVFELPRQDQLTKKQREILRLPKNGRYLIVGSPGTGKSIIALMRFKNFKDDDSNIFLTFNHVLNHSSKCLLDNQDFTNRMHTATSWIYNLTWKNMGTCMPAKSAYLPDYDKLKDVFRNWTDENPGKSKFDDYCLIIDEGQDLPRGWYEALHVLGIENFFVVADQNQQITEQHSNQQDLVESLVIDKTEIIKLEDNWRNNLPIARLCNYFYTDKSSPKPKLPNRPSASIPIFFEYKELNQVKDRILREYDFNPSKLIGLFVATDARREDWVKKLKIDNSPRDNPPPPISTYSAKSKKKDDPVGIDFSRGGIVVLNNASVKGIEFDIVFIQTDGFFAAKEDQDQDGIKKKMYVMCSRAREQLYIFKGATQNDSLTQLLNDILPPENEVDEYTPEGGNEIIKVPILKRITL